MSLTKSGWPRPVVDGMPIPWVSPSDDLSSMNSARAAACASGAICAVCGEGFNTEEECFALVRAEEIPAFDRYLVQAMDNAFMHRRCVRLALNVCPKLKELHASGLLRAVQTVGNIARVKLKRNRSVVGLLDGEDCAHICVDELKSQKAR